jgi:hypothetical protein
VSGQHDVLAGEGPGEPAGELRRRDAMSSQRRRAGRLFAGRALEVSPQERIARGDLVAKQFQAVVAADTETLVRTVGPAIQQLLAGRD